jgi:CTP-dependent riboflavin kinase
MEIKLVGLLKSNGVGLANKRLRACERILNKKGFFFPPLYFGTLNIELEREFLNSETDSIYISQKEIDEIPEAKGYAEWWKLFPIISINGNKTTGFVCRTQKTCHPPTIIELVTEDLRTWKNIELIAGEKFEIVLNSQKM